MTHVTCRLTTKNRNQLRNPTLGNQVGLWATFTFAHIILSVDRRQISDWSIRLRVCSYSLTLTSCLVRLNAKSRHGGLYVLLLFVYSLTIFLRPIIISKSPVPIFAKFSELVELWL